MIRFCTRCTVSSMRPRITFDADGVCSACRYAERQRAGIDWAARLDELQALLARSRRLTGYDVIVPCSGGKDSALVAHKLKHQWRMTPLCTTWSPFQYTKIGWENFQNFVHSGFDVLTAFPNGLIHRKLARLAFEFKGDAWEPFTFGQLCYPMNMAVRFNVPLVFFGENGEAIYSGDMTAADKRSYDYDDWDRVYLKGVGFDRLLKIGVELGAITSDEVRQACEFYRLPARETLDALGVQFTWWSYFNPWHPQSNYFYATENTGFRANPERSEGTYSKYASLDDKLDGFHFYFAYLKFGIGRCVSDAAHEVRDGDLERDEGMALVRKYDGEFPARNYGLFKDYLCIDDEQFQRVAERYTAQHAKAPADRAA